MCRTSGYPLHGHYFFVFGGKNLVALADEFVGDVLDLLFDLFDFVFGNGFVFQFLDFVHHVAAGVADVHLAVFDFALGAFAQLFAALFGQRGYYDAQYVAFVAWREAEVGVKDACLKPSRDGRTNTHSTTVSWGVSPRVLTNSMGPLQTLAVLD